MGELVTVMQENLSGIHVVKAFAAEEHEKEKFRRKAQELRGEYFASERLQGTNGAWMTFYFTLALGLIIWYGGWEVMRGDLQAGDMAKFLLLMNQLTFPVRMMPPDHQQLLAGGVLRHTAFRSTGRRISLWRSAGVPV